MPMNLHTIVSYLDSHLETEKCPEKISGLYFGKNKQIDKICFSVDLTQETIREAIKLGADLLITHHPIDKMPLTFFTSVEKRIKEIISSNLSVYSCHLPLDRKYNSIALAEYFGLILKGRFAAFNRYKIGVYGRCDKSRINEALERLRKDYPFSKIIYHDFGKKPNLIGIVTGNGLTTSVISEAEYLGIDTVISGEINYHGYIAAKESGINVIFLGHYLSELFGIKMLKNHIEKEFSVESFLIESREFY